MATRMPEEGLAPPMIAGIGAGKPGFAGSFVGLGGVRRGQICRVGGEVGDKEHADFGSAAGVRRTPPMRCGHVPRVVVGRGRTDHGSKAALALI